MKKTILILSFLCRVFNTANSLNLRRGDDAIMNDNIVEPPSSAEATASRNSLISGKDILKGAGPILVPKQKERIVGGIEARKGRYPYSVAILMDPELSPVDDDEFSEEDLTICGGSLIASEWVLTAAHCYGLGNRVQIGRHDFADTNETLNINYEEHEIEYSIVHPSYSNITLDFDAMLIKLKTPSLYPTIQLDDGSTPVSMESEFTIMGWGTVASFGPTSDVLLEASVDPVPFRTCFRRYSLYGGLTGNMFCAARRGTDACQGDSGGPLIIKGGATNEDDIQIGIVSWGIGCGTGVFPGVYTRVGLLNDFINENVELS